MSKSNGGNNKISFTKQKRGKTTIGSRTSSIKFSTMNKRKRATYKAYRGQGK